MNIEKTKSHKMGRPFRQKGEKDTKEKIFDAAIELFAKKGFKGTSVREIASVLALTEGAIYRHFSSKDEILEQVFNYAERVLFTALPIEESMGRFQGQSIFRGMLEPLPELIGSDPYMRKITRILYNEMNQNEKIVQHFMEYKNKTMHYTMDLFAKCMEIGTIRPCDLRSLSVIFNNFRSEWAYQNFIIDQSESLDLEKIKRDLDDVIVFLETSFTNSQQTTNV
jgi:AcrR family transcriptional regulator